MKTRRRKSKKGKAGSFYFFLFLFILLVIFGLNRLLFSENEALIKQEIIDNKPIGFSSFGIDVSHHQGKIDWQNLMVDFGFDSIIQFVYLKATEGSDFTDNQYDYNKSELKKLGVKCGAYHFYLPNEFPEAQAQHFLKTIQYFPGDLPPVIDVEILPKDRSRFLINLHRFASIIESELAVKPVIYTSRSIFETQFTKDFLSYSFWVASYYKTIEHIEDARIIHWQYSDKGKLPGISGHLDFNVSKIKYY